MLPNERRTGFRLSALMGVWIAVCINGLMLLLVFRADAAWTAPLLMVVFVPGIAQLISVQKRFLLDTARAVKQAHTREQL